MDQKQNVPIVNILTKFKTLNMFHLTITLNLSKHKMPRLQESIKPSFHILYKKDINRIKIALTIQKIQCVSNAFHKILFQDFKDIDILIMFHS